MSYMGIFTNAFKKDLKVIHKKNPKDLEQITHFIEYKILLDTLINSGCYSFIKKHHMNKVV